MNAFEIFAGSNGKATMDLYARLTAKGAVGIVALNLFRACKCSERAKVYSRRYRGDAYARKNWSLQLLCDALEKDSASLNIIYGWKQDPSQEFHNWVLYVETPCGQVSFHSASRGKGPDYSGEWDGNRSSASRICAWVNSLLPEDTFT